MFKNMVSVFLFMYLFCSPYCLSASSDDDDLVESQSEDEAEEESDSNKENKQAPPKVGGKGSLRESTIIFYHTPPRKKLRARSHSTPQGTLVRSADKLQIKVSPRTVNTKDVVYVISGRRRGITQHDLHHVFLDDDAIMRLFLDFARDLPLWEAANAPLYVGQTKNARDRSGQHFRDMISQDKNFDRKAEALRNLCHSGSTPVMQSFVTNVHQDQLLLFESLFIILTGAWQSLNSQGPSRDA